MTQINLLPWRETIRKEKQRQFVSVAVGAVLLMGAIIFYVHLHFGGQIDAQNERNVFLKKEISKVEAKIKEIRALEAEKASLLARMGVIQQLQGRRPEIVHIFYDLMRNVPSGIYLTSVKQKGTSIVIEGVAQSNARVSTLMRNLNATDWMEDPRLEVIQVDKAKRRVRASKFKLHVKQASLLKQGL